MPSSYASLGDTTGSILGALLGGGNAVENAKYSALGADAAASAVGARKASVETQKILDEIERERVASGITGRTVARDMGIRGDLYDAYQQGIDTGSYGTPVSAVGPVDTSRPPADLTPEMARQIKEADLLVRLKSMSGNADSNTNTLMETLLGGQKYTLGADTQSGVETNEDTAGVMAALAGKDLADDSARGWAQVNKPSDYETEAAAVSRTKGISMDQALAEVGAAKRTTQAERDAATLSLNDVASTLKIVIPEFDPIQYLMATQGPGGEAAGKAYMESVAANSKGGAAVVPMIESMMVPGMTVAPEVQGLLAALKARGDVAPPPTAPPASGPPPGWSGVVVK